MESRYNSINAHIRDLAEKLVCVQVNLQQTYKKSTATDDVMHARTSLTSWLFPAAELRIEGRRVVADGSLLLLVRLRRV